MSKPGLVFINSHPIQYFAPLYRELNEAGIPTACWYCSDETLHGHTDRQFGVSVSWDIPLLQGYAHRFFRNRSWRPSLYNGFFGLINPGMVTALFRLPKSIIVVHGWGYLSLCLSILAASWAGHRVCLRGESPWNQEVMKARWKQLITRVFFRIFLRPCVDHYMYIGTENKKFYLHQGVEERRLVFVPYAVDNGRFNQERNRQSEFRRQVRHMWGLQENSKIILFAAKWIDKKRPMDLMKAFQLINDPSVCLVMVGDGELRGQMERFRNENQLNIRLVGFVNQQEIAVYYAAADVFVLCSGFGETWGLAVNEVMNFGIPVVVSDTSGCSYDLIDEGKTGYRFETGNCAQLADVLTKALALPIPVEHTVLNTYSYEGIRKGIESIR